jgi:hypothetical protein
VVLTGQQERQPGLVGRIHRASGALFRPSHQGGFLSAGALGRKAKARKIAL